MLAFPAAGQNTPAFETHAIDPTDLIVADFGRATEGGPVQSILQIRTAQTMFDSASTPGRGTIRFIDPARLPGSETMEMGFYEWGAGIFTENLFEFWTAGLSVRSLRGDASYLAVRDYLDTKDIRLLHDGDKGVITTTGLDPGGIAIDGNGPISLLAREGDVSLTAAGGVNIGGTAGPITVDGHGTVSVLGDNSVTVESRANSLTLRGSSRITIDGDGPVSMEGSGAVTVEASSGNVAVLGASGAVIDGGNSTVAITGHDVTVNAPTGIINAQAGTAMTLTGGTTTSLQGRDVAIKSTLGSVAVDANSAATINAGGIVSVVGGGSVALSAGGPLSATAATGDVTLQATSGEVKLKAGAGSPVRVDSTGSLYVQGDIYLKGQPLGTPTNGGTPSGGEFISIAPLPIYFGAIGGSGSSWNCDASDVVTYGYARTGNVVTVWFVIALSSVSGSPQVLTLAIPENLRAAAQTESFCHISDDHSNYQIVPCLVAAGETKIRVYRQSYYGTPWPTTTNKTSVRGTLTFPVMP